MSASKKTRAASRSAARSLRVASDGAVTPNGAGSKIEQFTGVLGNLPYGAQVLQACYVVAAQLGVADDHEAIWVAAELSHRRLLQSGCLEFLPANARAGGHDTASRGETRLTSASLVLLKRDFVYVLCCAVLDDRVRAELARASDATKALVRHVVRHALGLDRVDRERARAERPLYDPASVRLVATRTPGQVEVAAGTCAGVLALAALAAGLRQQERNAESSGSTVSNIVRSLFDEPWVVGDRRGGDSAANGLGNKGQKASIGRSVNPRGIGSIIAGLLKTARSRAGVAPKRVDTIGLSKLSRQKKSPTHNGVDTADT